MKKIAIAIVVAISLTLAQAPLTADKKADKKDPKTKPAATKPVKKVRLFQHFRELFRDSGKNNTHKVKIISGPTPVKMRNGRDCRWRRSSNASKNCRCPTYGPAK